MLATSDSAASREVEAYQQPHRTAMTRTRLREAHLRESRTSPGSSCFLSTDQLSEGLPSSRIRQAKDAFLAFQADISSQEI